MGSIFDALTGDPVHAAQDSTRNYLGALQTNLSGASNNAYGGAFNFLKDAFGNARTDLTTGYGATTAPITTGASSAQGYLDGSLGDLRGLFDKAITTVNDVPSSGMLGKLADSYAPGAQLFADAYGVNGAEGNTRATQAFQAGPGFQEGIDAGLDAINRRRAAGGMLNSGNADRDAQKFGQTAQNQEFNNWRTGLAPFNNLQLTATTGAANAAGDKGHTLASLYGQEAGLVDNAGRAKAGVATNEGGSLADIATRYYGGLAGNDVNSGAALGGNLTDMIKNIQAIGLNVAPQFTNTYQRDADADMAASKNTIGLGLSLAQLAAGGAGGLGAGGAGGSSFLPSASFLKNGMNWG